MGLQHITEDGNLHWDCHSGKCPPQQAHISHEQVEWMEDGDLVGLPQCECGTRTFIKTKFTEQELAEPIVTRGVHPITGKEGILSVQVPGAPNLTWMNVHYEKWMVNGEETTIQIIDEVFQHPMVARHLELKRQLHAAGKKPA